MIILIISKNAAISSLMGLLLLNPLNQIVEPKSMREANSLLLERHFDIVLYGVSKEIPMKIFDKTKIIYVANDSCEVSLK